MFCVAVVEFAVNGNQALKGCNSSKEAAQKRNEQIEVLPGDFVHKECTKQYTNPNVTRALEASISPGRI